MFGPLTFCLGLQVTRISISMSAMTTFRAKVHVKSDKNSVYYRKNQIKIYKMTNIMPEQGKKKDLAFLNSHFPSILAQTET